MSRKKIANYVKKSSKKLFEQKIGSFHVFLKDGIPENIDIDYVFSRVESLIPDSILSLVDVVYVGEFDIFKKRNINASYIDGALYISNKQDNNPDMVDDIVHELAHAIEDHYNNFLYDDEEIKEEYFSKLKKLKSYLAFEGYDIRSVNFFNEKYNADFDNFLHKDVGYAKLAGFTKDIFFNPYSCTSLREYFSTGFENYFLNNNHDLLKVMCPYVYKKVYILVNNSPEEIKYGYDL